MQRLYSLVLVIGDVGMIAPRSGGFMPCDLQPCYVCSLKCMVSMLSTEYGWNPFVKYPILY